MRDCLLFRPLLLPESTVYLYQIDYMDSALVYLTQRILEIHVQPGAVFWKEIKWPIGFSSNSLQCHQALKHCKKKKILLSMQISFFACQQGRFPFSHAGKVNFLFCMPATSSKTGNPQFLRQILNPHSIQSIFRFSIFLEDDDLDQKIGKIRYHYEYILKN